jgi:C-terminal processing protease CtpA/Prc
MSRRNAWVGSVMAVILTGLPTPQARSQQRSNFERDRALIMLDTVAADVRKHYYDRSFHGIDWDAKVAETRQKIKQETSLNMSLAHIAQALLALDDSHTFFVPPQRPYRHDYGFQTEMIGDKCFIIRVRPGSDAEAEGLKPGDEVVTLEGFRPDRDNLWKMDYRYNLVRPEASLRLVLRDVQGQERQVDVLAKFHELPRVKDVTGNGIWSVILDVEREQHQMRARTEEVGDELLILKLPAFFFDQSEIDSLIDKARKHQALIVDLRGNPGGAVDTLKYLVGGIFEDEVKIADRVGRKESKPEVAKSTGRRAFGGKVIALVDSKSASAAELFARVLQLEKRGVVVGDHSSGSVMEAKEYSYTSGEDTVVFYGASITASDLIMSDGKSLEHSGVTPDEIVLPTASDLASGRDPVLSRAAALLGAKLTPEDAGKLFPYEWPQE